MPNFQWDYWKLFSKDLIEFSEHLDFNWNFFVHSALMLVIKNLTTQDPTVTKFFIINNQTVNFLYAYMHSYGRASNYSFCLSPNKNHEFWFLDIYMIWWFQVRSSNFDLGTMKYRFCWHWWGFKKLCKMPDYFSRERILIDLRETCCQAEFSWFTWNCELFFCCIVPIMAIKMRWAEKSHFEGLPVKWSNISIHPVRTQNWKHIRQKSITALIQFKRETKKENWTFFIGQDQIKTKTKN